MNLDLAPTTRMAVRAAAVAAGAVGVGRIWDFDRPYWIILTAVVLVYETAGESIKRSGQRLVMTVAGCLVGWLLYLFAAPIPVLRWTILLGGIFLAVYYRSDPRGAVYAPMIFFVSLYVVFVFALVGGWTGKLFLTRAYDTAIGCALALAGSLLVLPVRAGHQLEHDLERFWSACRQYFEKAFASLMNSGPVPAGSDRQALLKQLEQLKVRSGTSAYEGFLGRTASKRQRNLVEHSEAMCRHLLAFGAVVQAGMPSQAVAAIYSPLHELALKVGSGFEHLNVIPGERNPDAALKPSCASELYECILQILYSHKPAQVALLEMGVAVYHLQEVCQRLEQANEA
jgi:uncharacterized membrane protein YccC